MDRAVKEDSIVELASKKADDPKFGPSSHIDYLVVRGLAEFFSGEEAHASSGLPSIDCMYKNLANILNGQSHWIFPGTFEGGQEAIDLLRRSKPKEEEEWEWRFMYQSLVILCYELPNESIKTKQAFISLRLQFLDGIHSPRMSANRFVEFYMHSIRDSKIDYRFDCIHKGYGLFRDFWHKGVCPAQMIVKKYSTTR